MNVFAHIKQNVKNVVKSLCGLTNQRNGSSYSAVLFIAEILTWCSLSWRRSDFSL